MEQLTPEVRRGTPLNLPTDKDLPSDDFGGEPVALLTMPTDRDLPCQDPTWIESPWHRDQSALLIDSLQTHWRDRTDFYVGGNMYLYFHAEQSFDREFPGPDFFVVKGVGRFRPRLSWVTWQEGGINPHAIIELSSDTTAALDLTEKKQLYGERLRVSEYFVYDPRTRLLVGWKLAGSRFGEPLEICAGNSIWSQQLQLFIGPWHGEYLGRTDHWLRFFDGQGRLIPTGREFAAAALRQSPPSP
jgi:Uma2 family endonuclease